MNAVGLIGYGGIARDVVAALRAMQADAGIVGALARLGRADNARAALPGIDIVESLDDLLARKPRIVAEVAGQQAVKDYGENILRRGVDFLVISIGALAEPALLQKLRTSAAEGGARVLLP